jgi:hypothetical protein
MAGFYIGYFLDGQVVSQFETREYDPSIHPTSVNSPAIVQADLVLDGFQSRVGKSS